MIKKIVTFSFLATCTLQIETAVKEFEKFVKTNPTAENLAVKIDNYSPATAPATFKSAATLITGPDAQAYQIVFDEASRKLAPKGDKRNAKFELEKFRNGQRQAAAEAAQQEAAQQQAAAQQRPLFQRFDIDINDLLRRLDALEAEVNRLRAEQTARMTAAGL